MPRDVQERILFYIRETFYNNKYNKSLQKKSTFLKRMITALFIYILTTITYVVITVTFGKFNIESTSGDKLFLALINSPATNGCKPNACATPSRDLLGRK